MRRHLSIPTAEDVTQQSEISLRVLCMPSSLFSDPYNIIAQLGRGEIVFRCNSVKLCKNQAIKNFIFSKHINKLILLKLITEFFK